MRLQVKRVGPRDYASISFELLVQPGGWFAKGPILGAYWANVCISTVGLAARRVQRCWAPTTMCVRVHSYGCTDNTQVCVRPHACAPEHMHVCEHIEVCPYANIFASGIFSQEHMAKARKLTTAYRLLQKFPSPQDLAFTLIGLAGCLNTGYVLPRYKHDTDCCAALRQVTVSALTPMCLRMYG